MAPFLQVLFDRSIVRSSLVFGLLTRRTWPLALLLSVASIACRVMDGFHQSSPIPQWNNKAFWTKHGVSWFLG
jgi:hypothetical protein